MKIRKILLIVLLFACILPLVFVACKKDKKSDVPDDGTQQVIPPPDSDISPKTFSISGSIADDGIVKSSFIVRSGSESYSASGTKTIEKGTSVTYVITPSLGRGIRSILVDGSEVFSEELFDSKGEFSYTFSNVNSNHTISAVISDFHRISFDENYSLQRASLAESNVALDANVLSVDGGFVLGREGRVFIPHVNFADISKIFVRYGESETAIVVSEYLNAGKRNGFTLTSAELEGVQGLELALPSVGSDIDISVVITPRQYTIYISSVEEGEVVDVIPRSCEVFFGVPSATNCIESIFTSSNFTTAYFATSSDGISKRRIENFIIEGDRIYFPLSGEMLLGTSLPFMKVYTTQVDVRVLDELGNILTADISYTSNGIRVSGISGMTTSDVVRFGFASNVEYDGGDIVGFDTTTLSSTVSGGFFVLAFDSDMIIENTEGFADRIYIVYKKLNPIVLVFDGSDSFEVPSGTVVFETLAGGLKISGIFGDLNISKVFARSVQSSFVGTQADKLLGIISPSGRNSTAILFAWEDLEEAADGNVYIVLQQIEVEIFKKVDGEFVRESLEYVIEDGKIKISRASAQAFRWGISDRIFDDDLSLALFSGAIGFEGSFVVFDFDSSGVISNTITVVYEQVSLRVYSMTSTGELVFEAYAHFSDFVSADVSFAIESGNLVGGNFFSLTDIEYTDSEISGYTLSVIQLERTGSIVDLSDATILNGSIYIIFVRG